ncbi:uncharacterized protein MONBRDRAFT_22102 [Monosiga brevicollis MX1]|uniref:Uncharacterized protein n=1 Tax=Monosiga brevicollis TaxID=81824 RepID=A9UPK4_MONBE|nr:uncharacterized protein MONBRDRAFT_22102 [Monosiga brevicollis MX1]EDQ92440.1 predicted protein [Monosiga brevicollis MX1]|eukprot:XP_001742202.1 hypothetical protein [Monosiga brevicollis MX1]
MDRFMFAVLGLLAVLCLLGYSFRKSKALLKSGLLLSLISLVAVGGPLDDSGRFLWNCMQKDPTTGSRYEPQGCQEETYDNYALIFTGSFTFALFHTLATYFATMAPMHSRFTFKDDDSLSDRFEPNTAQ